MPRRVSDYADASEGGGDEGSVRTSTQWFRLNAEGNRDPELLLTLLQDGNHDFGTIVDGKDDIFHPSLISSVMSIIVSESCRIHTLTRASIWCKLHSRFRVSCDQPRLCFSSRMQTKVR